MPGPHVTAGLDIPALLKELTLEEKAQLVDGSDFWHTQPVERLGIPAIMLSDGPHGLRKQQGEGTISASSTASPPPASRPPPASPPAGTPPCSPAWGRRSAASAGPSGSRSSWVRAST
ncbi:hypothetical protein ACQPXT_04880 [Streptomyces sp. CA-100214]